MSVAIRHTVSVTHGRWCRDATITIWHAVSVSHRTVTSEGDEGMIRVCDVGWRRDSAGWEGRWGFSFWLVAMVITIRVYEIRGDWLK